VVRKCPRHFGTGAEVSRARNVSGPKCPYTVIGVPRHPEASQFAVFKVRVYYVDGSFFHPFSLSYCSHFYHHHYYFVDNVYCTDYGDNITHRSAQQSLLGCVTKVWSAEWLDQSVGDVWQ